MKDNLIISAKERKRKVILEDVKRSFISLKEAAARLEVGYRQAKRIYSAYRSSGDAAIVHKSLWSQFNPGWFKKSRRSRQNSAITHGDGGHF